MALGLALDVCQIGWSQGDDLYSYMDNRIAAGAEHVAALNFGQDLHPRDPGQGSQSQEDVCPAQFEIGRAHV